MTTLIADHISTPRQGCAALGETEECLVERSVTLAPHAAPPPVKPSPVDVLSYQSVKASRSRWFITAFAFAIGPWTSVNSSFGGQYGLVFDPYPRDLLTLVLSMIASIQGLIILLISRQHTATSERATAETMRRSRRTPTLESLRLHERLDGIERILMSHREDEMQPNELSSTRSPTGVTESFSASYFDGQAPDPVPDHRRVAPVCRPDRQAGSSPARALPIT